MPSRLCAAISFILLLASLASTAPAQAGASCAVAGQSVITCATGKRLVGYYGSWSKEQTPAYSSAQIPYTELTHIIHAGVNVSDAGDGSFTLPGDFLEPALLTSAHAAGVKVLFYLGGSGAAFSSIAASPTARAALIAGLQGVIPVYGYDGIDIDWEYPNGATDNADFTELMTELRAAFPAPAYVTSIDVPNIPSDGYGFAGLIGVVDMFNVMMYDAAGPWTHDVQMNSPIYSDPANPNPQGSVAQAASDYTGLYGVPAAQINMGTPFYGYWYRLQNTLYQRCLPCRNVNVPGESYGTFIKQNINQNGWTREFNTIQQVPYLVKTDGNAGFITYDDAGSTAARITYAVWTRGLGGSFMWSLDADYDGSTQDLLDAMYQATMGGAD